MILEWDKQDGGFIDEGNCYNLHLPTAGGKNSWIHK